MTRKEILKKIVRNIKRCHICVQNEHVDIYMDNGFHFTTSKKRFKEEVSKQYGITEYTFW